MRRVCPWDVTVYCSSSAGTGRRTGLSGGLWAGDAETAENCRLPAQRGIHRESPAPRELREQEGRRERETGGVQSSPPATWKAVSKRVSEELRGCLVESRASWRIG